MLFRSKFDNFYNNLSSFVENVKLHSGNAEKRQEEIKQKLVKKVEEVEANVLEEGENVEEVAACLVDMKIISDNISAVKSDVYKKIDNVLSNYKSNNADSFLQLGAVLEKNTIGKIIVSEHKCFEGKNIYDFNERTGIHGIDYVLKELDGDLIDVKKLKKRYERFEESYKELIKPEQLDRKAHV